MEREVGGGIGMGNTCKPMAVLFQCMTKFTTNKKKKKNMKVKGPRWQWLRKSSSPVAKWQMRSILCYCLVAQSCLTLCDPMDCSPPGSSVHRIFQVRILEWGCHSLLQGIFLTEGSNPSLLHWQADSLPLSRGLSL